MEPSLEEMLMTAALLQLRPSLPWLPAPGVAEIPVTRTQMLHEMRQACSLCLAGGQGQQLVMCWPCRCPSFCQDPLGVLPCMGVLFHLTIREWAVAWRRPAQGRECLLVAV